jgi:hypothetical protein
MKTRTYNTYSFDELSPEARERAIEDHRQFIGEHENGEYVIEDAKRVLSLAGFNIDRVYYSGFWSQGDGACFEGSWDASKVNAAAMHKECPVDTELHRIADSMAAIAKVFPFASFTVKHSGHYCHQYSTSFDVSIANEEGDEIDTPEREKAEESLIELARDAMEWIYNGLEKEYDYQTAEEQVIESIRANEYEFTEDGKID